VRDSQRRRAGSWVALALALAWLPHGAAARSASQHAPEQLQRVEHAITLQATSLVRRTGEGAARTRTRAAAGAHAAANATTGALALVSALAALLVATHTTQSEWRRFVRSRRGPPPAARNTSHHLT
jgi:hypothetical protein